MTSSIPDGFSLEQLQQMMETAPSESCEHQEETCTCGGDSMTPDQEKIFNAVKHALRAVEEEFCDPAVMKTAAAMAITTLCDWHKSVAERKFGKDDIEALGWAMDARSLEIALDVISRINVGPNDWMV